MRVRDGMTTSVLMVGPDHTLREAAALMARLSVGAAVVLDTDSEGPGIITERDLLHSVAAGQDPNREVVRDHVTQQAIIATGESSLHEAAEAMIRGGFRHLIIVDDTTEPVGMLSIRDIVRCWMVDGALPD
jgi:CBS domain-containing protein